MKLLIKASLRFLRSLNELPGNKLQLMVGENKFAFPSFDRFAYLLLHKYFLMGRAETPFFNRHIKPGDVVVDVGANIGFYTVCFARAVGPEGRVFAFEPQPELFRFVLRNLEINGLKNVTVSSCAVGAGNDVLSLRHGLLNSGNNCLARRSDSVLEFNTRVQVSTLDELVGASAVDWVKIDVQGWEPAVLDGMTQILQRNAKIRVFFEFWPEGLMRAGYDPLQFLQFFEQNEFQLSDADSERIVPIHEFDALVRRRGYFNLLASRARES